MKQLSYRIIRFFIAEARSLVLLYTFVYDQGTETCFRVERD